MITGLKTKTKAKENKTGTNESGIEAEIVTGRKPEHLIGKYPPVRDFLHVFF